MIWRKRTRGLRIASRKTFTGLLLHALEFFEGSRNLRLTMKLKIGFPALSKHPLIHTCT